MRYRALFFIAPLLLVGCSTPSASPSRALAAEVSPVQLRSIQTRVYDTGDETRILSAAVGVLQDLGFSLEESTPALGVLVGSKERSLGGGPSTSRGADSPGPGIFDEAVSKFLREKWGIEATSGGAGHTHEVEEVQTYDTKEQVRVSLVTRPHGEEANGRIMVRLTFQRVIWNNLGAETSAQSLSSRDHYEEFFAKLSQAVFLDAHEI